MTLLIKELIDPFNILWFLVLTGIISYTFKKITAARYIWFGAGIWFLIISTPLAPTLLLNSLESQYRPISVDQLSDNQQAGYHIIVLGGGHGYDDRLPTNSLLSLQALARLNEGIRLHNQLSNSRLILSGYSASGRIPNAVMLRDTALLLGVDPERTSILPEPANTFEEAKYYSKRFLGEDSVILVTSASHMPRAVGVFQHFNVQVNPSPAHYRIKESQRNRWVGWPSISNISNLNSGMNEYAAIMRDWWMGRRLNHLRAKAKNK